jgi:hypothetical protein
MIPPNSGGIVYEDRRSDDGHWLLIRYGDTTGWVASRYLREESPPNTVAPPRTALPPPASSPSADRAARERAAAEERERLQKHAEQEKLKRRLDDLGFRLLEPIDLSLDWKAYVANQTKVALIGTYLEANDVEELSTPDNKDQPTIRLYTNDATRAARKAMLECRNSNFSFSLCQMAVGAVVQACVRNKGQLNEKEIPCLKVQEAYVVP